MKFAKEFIIPKWDDSIKQLVISYWQERGIKFTEISDNMFLGNRGNFLGNLISFNMAKIMTKLNISITDNLIFCEFDINTAMQQITSWNKRYWELELETFESVLLRNDYQEKVWDEFKKSSKKKDFLWILWIIVAVLLINIFRLLTKRP